MLAFARICVRLFAYGHTLHADPRGWGSKGAGTNAALVCRVKMGCSGGLTANDYNGLIQSAKDAYLWCLRLVCDTPIYGRQAGCERRTGTVSTNAYTIWTGVANQFCETFAKNMQRMGKSRPSDQSATQEASESPCAAWGVNRGPYLYSRPYCGCNGHPASRHMFRSCRVFAFSML